MVAKRSGKTIRVYVYGLIVDLILFSEIVREIMWNNRFGVCVLETVIYEKLEVGRFRINRAGKLKASNPPSFKLMAEMRVT